MNVQLSAVSAASVRPTVVRAAPLPGNSGQMEAATPQPRPPPAKVQAAVSPQQPISDEVVRQAAREVNSYLKASNSSLQFEVDGKSKQVVVRIVDSETKELIRQIPSEEMLAISHSLDKMTGLLLAQKA